MTARIKSSLWLVLFFGSVMGLYGLLAAQGGSPDVLSSYTVEGLRKSVIVGGEYMNLPFLRLCYELERSISPARVSIVTVFEDRELAIEANGGKGHSEIAYSDWKRRYGAMRNLRGVHTMRLVSIGSDAVLQTAEMGNVSRLIVAGTDPTMMNVDGVQCELLDLYWTRLPAPIREDGGNPLRVDVYVKTGRLPTEAEASQITRRLQTRIGHDNMTVSIRTDSWFIESSRFPVRFSFAEDQPPSLEEYVSRGSAFCIGEAGSVRCRRTLPQ